MFRAATEADLLALTELERDANLVALAHVFPPERHPFPFDEVLARWRLVLDDPTAEVLVRDRELGGLEAYVAYDAETLRHLAVHPSAWGTGLGTAAVDIAVAGIARHGTARATLWVLEENHHARRLYDRLGWAVTGEQQPAPWPPHPVELAYARQLG